MAMFADTMSNLDLHMRNINSNGLVLLSNHRRPLRSRDFEKSRRLNLLSVIGKALASSFEWCVNRQHPESLKIIV